jgi:hypothetical protein
MNERIASTRYRTGIDRDAVRRVELQVQSILAAAGAVFGAAAAVLAVTHLGIASEFIFMLGLLAVAIGTAAGVLSASRVTSALRR